MRYLVKYRHGNRNKNEIALTLDDGPSNLTPEFLFKLNMFGIKATFFVIPQNVRALPKVAKDILARGHELGLHVVQPKTFSWTQAFFQRTNESAIDDAVKTINEVCGIKPRFFRPSPEMAVSRGIGQTLKKRGLIPILASAYSRVHRPVEMQVYDITKNLNSGDIILLHDGHDLLRESPRPENDLKILPKVVEEAHSKGLTFVTISQLIEEPPYYN